MNNKQRAAARRVLNQYPNLRPQEIGNTLTIIDVTNETSRTSLDVSPSLDARQLERDLIVACGALS